MRTKFMKGLVVGLCTTIFSCVSSYAAPVCYDFNDNQIPPGTQLGDGLQGTARIQDGMLQINLAGVNGDCGSFFIPDPAAGAPQNSLLMTWRSYIGNGNAGADGYSMSWGANVNPGCVGEDGVGGSDLIVSIDTFDNGTRPNGTACDDCDEGNDYGVAIDWRGTRIAFDKAGRTLATPGKAFLRKGTFVDATVLVENGTATFNYDGLTISGPVDIGTTPVTGGNFMFGGRTGGANDNHWIDDLFINCVTAGAIAVTDEPDDAAVTPGGRATFMTQVDGTPPYTYEWRSNGVVIASGTTYHRNRYITTPASTTADDGDRYQLRASNAEGSVTTREAVLRVQTNPQVLKASAPAANRVVVLYSSPVQLAPGSYTIDGTAVAQREYGASHSEVAVTPATPLVANQTYTLVIRDVLGEGSNLPILPNPTTKLVRFGFGTPFCADFNDNQTPAGTQLVDGGLGTATIADGVLKLNLDGVNGDCGGYFVPNQAGAAPLDFLAVTWKSLIGGINDPGEAQQFGHGADGYSFSWGSGVTATCVGDGGMGSGLIISVDTFENAGEEGYAPGLEMIWRGTRVASREAVPGNNQASKNFLRKSRFVDVGLLVKDGNATLNYDGITLTAALAGFGEGLANANFLFGGSTGGANDNQWIDDLKINCFTAGPAVVVQDPADTTVRDGDTATFTVQVDGTPPYSFQWYKNGEAIAGANSSTYITPPTTAADDGAQFYVVVSNEAGSDTSATATLHINIVPRVTRVFSRGNNRVHVLYSSAVQLDSGNYVFNMGEFGSTREYGASHSEVVLTTDIELVEGLSYTLEISDVLSESSNLPLDPNPTVVQFGHGFGTPVCYDFNDNQAPPGTTLGDGSLNTARIENGILHLTDAQNGDCGSFFIPNQAGSAPLAFLVAAWRSYIGDGAAGADGYSFNWGSDVSAGCAGAVEDGTTGTGLVVGVDTFDNGTTPGDIAVDGPTDYGIEIKWRGQRIAYDKAGRNTANPGKQFLRKSRFVNAALSVDNAVATFEYDGIVISGTLPNFGSGIANGNFLLAARTGGANDNHWIDDLRINCFAREGLILVDDIEDATVIEGQTATFSAEVDGFPPYNYQWTRNGTVVASGVTYNRMISYTTPPTGEADDGARFQLQVSNSAGSVSTREAVLDVLLNPRVLEVYSIGANEVHVIYHRPVVLDSGTYTVFGAGTPLLCNDFNSNDGGFTVDTPIPYDGPWVWNAATGTWQQDGQAAENSHPNTSMLNSPSLTVSAAGVVKLSFVHRWSFEADNWDGGQVRVSVNGGPFTAVPGSAFTQGGYNGAVRGDSASQLAGQQAYVLDSAGRAAGNYTTSEANIGNFNVGDVIRVQFMAASDTNTKGPHSPNWEIDSVCIREGGAFGVTSRSYGATHNEVILTTALNLVLGENYTLQIADVVGEGTGDLILPNPTIAPFRHGFRNSQGNNLFIEAEDFNTASGDYIPSNPSTGVSFNAKLRYNTLGATPNIDYNDAGDGQESNLYRTEGVNNIPHVNMVCTEGGVRPGFEMGCDYKIGWTGGGDWYNYTRTFPAGNYTVWARLSHGDPAATIGGGLSEVTSDRRAAGQTTTRLGSFRAPSTANWDGFTFVPLRDDAGNVIDIPLAGEQTLRYTVEANGGDFNYLMFVFQRDIVSITCPDNIVAGNDPGQCCGTVTYTVTATGGTPTCTPPSGTCFAVGTTTVNCSVSDATGDTATCSFTVTVEDRERPQITCPNNIVVPEIGPVTFVPTASDNCGNPTVVCTPASGSPFPQGVTTVNCTATDASGNSASCSFTVTAGVVNEPPQCRIDVACALTYDNDPNEYVIALDNEAACVVLDGSGSTDPDGDTLTHVWVVDGTLVHTGAVFAVRLPLGCHSVILIVSDGKGGTSRCEETVCVITPCEGLQRCIDMVDESNLGRKNKRPFIASLKAACASFDRGNMESGMNQMKAFQNKVRAQVSKSNPEEAEAFNECIDDLREAIECQANVELSGLCGGEDNGE